MKSSQVVTVMGQRGSGKSSYIKAVIPSFSRVLVWDPMSEYNDPRFDRIEDLGDLYEYLAKRKDSFFQVVFSPESDSLFDRVVKVFPESIEEYNSNFAISGAMFVIEEVDIQANPRCISEGLSKLVRRGRHYEISLMFTTRRPAEMNRILDTQSNKFVCFKMIGANEYNYMRSIMGEVAGDLKSLEPLEFIEYDGEARRGHVEIRNDHYSIRYH